MHNAEFDGIRLNLPYRKITTRTMPKSAVTQQTKVYHQVLVISLTVQTRA